MNIVSMRRFCWLLALIPASTCLAQTDADQLEFFEKKVRPVLAGNCYGCHNSKMKSANGRPADRYAGRSPARRR